MPLPEVEKKRRRSLWFLASSVTAHVTLRSRVGWFLGHWKGGSVRCPGEDQCSICASGAQQRLFTYFFVELHDGNVMVFEMPERLVDTARELENAPGTMLAITRDGLFKNSPILVVITGHRDVEELDLEPFMNTIGWSKESKSPTQEPVRVLPFPEARPHSS